MILVITSFDPQIVPIGTWLDGSSYCVVASGGASTSHNSKAIRDLLIGATDWEWIPSGPGRHHAICRTVQTWHRSFVITDVVALAERDLNLAADLRTSLNIEHGQRQQSAEAFVNKGSMYSAVDPTGLCPRWETTSTPIETSRRLLSQAGVDGVVIKPAESSGSRDTHFAFTPHELSTLEILTVTEYIVQEFVPWPLYHLDCWVMNGEIQQPVLSRYATSTFAPSKGEVLMSVESSDLKALSTATEATARMLNAIDGRYTGPIHAEWFISADYEIRFCEVAARVGGAGVAKTYEFQTGTNLFQEHVRACTGHLASALPPSEKPSDLPLYGWASIPLPVGHLIYAPHELNHRNVVHIRQLANTGNRYAGSDSSGTGTARIVCKGESESALLQTLEEAVLEYQENVMVAN